MKWEKKKKQVKKASNKGKIYTILWYLPKICNEIFYNWTTNSFIICVTVSN